MTTRGIADEDRAVDALLAEWLAAPAPRLTDLPPSAAIIARIRHHGIAGLLFERLGKHADLPEDLAQFLRGEAIGRSFWEDAHAKVMREAIAAMIAAGARPLLFKGTALAYAHYTAPFTRERGDSDVIVAPERFAAACAALDKAGFNTPFSVRGSLVAATRVFRTRDPMGHTHEIDLHCRISNSATLGGLFTFAELVERSQPLARLSDAARALGPSDAMMVACFHRQMHATGNYFVGGVEQHDPDRLIWLADIDRLTRSMSEDEWHQLVTLAAGKGLASSVASGLRAAQAALGTPLPSAPLRALDAQAVQTPASRFLTARSGERMLRDLLATPGFSQKFRFLRELLLPPPAYVRAILPDGRVRWLPWLYARYIASRAAKRAASLWS
jgi:hypothetical protein